MRRCLEPLAPIEGSSTCMATATVTLVVAGSWTVYRCDEHWRAVRNRARTGGVEVRITRGTP